MLWRKFEVLGFLFWVVGFLCFDNVFGVMFYVVYLRISTSCFRCVGVQLSVFGFQSYIVCARCPVFTFAVFGCMFSVLCFLLSASGCRLSVCCVYVVGFRCSVVVSSVHGSFIHLSQ